MSNLSPAVVAVGMIVATILIIGVDILLARDSRRGNTYSEIIREAGRKWTPLILIITFSFGLLVGHWFWSFCALVVARGIGVQA